LRRMYLTTINNSCASFLERKDIADAVGHSVEESLKYAFKVKKRLRKFLSKRNLSNLYTRYIV